MEALPSSVEAYLLEAGFSGTEIVILKKLLTENALTQRELASKTGKSTGVLDQATKKLMKKGIVTRETINGTPKYVMQSLDTVVQWMQNDMSAKQDMLQRRHENFESFVRSLTVTTQKRPEMEYFEGLEGMKKAYTQILEYGNDIVQYGPTLYLAEEDPLRDFRVQYFRERRGRSIFSRVVTHDTVLGRRAQSRDPFEYRRTILVDPEIYPFSFEKIISGETVACFDLEQNRACFIHFPQLALDEKIFFDRLWNKKVGQAKTNVPESEMNVPAQRPVVDVPLRTRTLSQVREFMLSRKSVTTFASFALIAAAVTYGLYRHNVSLNTQRIQERVKSIAATGTLQFDAADLNELRTLKDIDKPQYAKVVYQLNQIRNQNEGVKFVYLMRATEQPTVLEFIADADSSDPASLKDLNNDGTIDYRDQLSPPGEQYETKGLEPVPIAEAFERAVGFGPTTDQWGILISGWAPVKDESGKTTAILGVDVDAERVDELTNATFIPLYYFLGFFALFIFIRLAAFNRSLFKEIWDLLRTRKALYALISILMVVYWILFGWNIYSQKIAREEIGKRLMAIAATAALQINADDLEPLRFARDMKREEYQKVFRQLNDIRDQNPEITYIYVMRPTETENIWEFVVDADSNVFLPVYMDVNNDKKLNEADENSFPGMRYDGGYSLPIVNHYGLKRPVIEISIDQWGKFVTASAPIIDISGVAVAILGIDVDLNSL